MRHGLVQKVAVTAANEPDGTAVKNVCPDHGALCMDKMYDTKKTDASSAAKGWYPATIRNNTNKMKTRDVDRWRSGIRMPFEGTVSKMNTCLRYRGHAKVVMQCFREAIVHNLKKAVRSIPTAVPMPV